MGIEGYVLHKINLDAWIKFVCSVYLMKHKTLFNSEPIASLYTSLMATPLADDKVQLLKWLAYDKVVPLRKILPYIRGHHTTEKPNKYLIVLVAG